MIGANQEPLRAGNPNLGYRRFIFERSIPIPKPSYYSNSEWKKQSGDDRKTFWRCDYPVFTGGPASTLINRTLKKYMLTVATNQDEPPKIPISPESAAEALIASYQKERRESGSELPFQVAVKGSVLLNKPGLLSVRINAHLFFGGAHGLDPIKLFVFNSNTGSQLNLADIFVPQFDARLNSLINRAFRRKNGLSTMDQLDHPKGGYFGLSIKQLNYTNNFALSNDGMIFVYNEYEIAAYANGPTEILIPWSELHPLLKEDFKAQYAITFAQ
ncbi:MAG: DUF3298 domain-containing protein [Chlorobiaceae bacterium]|nr:DUF3298 domain-containing protein [Chlorobiaceae bacterium]